MAATYKGILTNNGKALIAGATINNKINYSHIAVGDGNGSAPTPLETRTALVNEKARIALNVVEINPNNTNQIVCEAIIPTNIGGFYIRELGLYADNTMVVNANYPPTYKPLADEGGAREIAIKIVINIQNAEVIALYLDDSLIYATREWVNNNYIRRNELIDNLTTNDATKPLTAKQGKVLQDNKLDKTANAVSASKWQTARTISYSGAATGSVSLDGSANASCVLTLANSGVTANTYGSNIVIPIITFNAKGLATGVSTQTIRSASTSQTGVVQLTDDLLTDDASKALTAKQGKVLQDNKLDKTTNAVGIVAFENRTLKPTQLKSSSVQAAFGTLNSDSSTQYADFLTLNGWNDSSGGSKNALVFSKTTQELFHYQASYDSQTWTIKKKIAYTDSDSSGNAATSTKLKTPRKINLIDFDGTQDISIEAPLRYLGNITTSAQLDSAVTDGKYTVSELNVAGLYGYGFLVVLRSGGVCCQIYYPHLAGGANNGTLAIRQSWNTNGNGATWSEWRAIGTRDDSKLPLTGGSLTGNLTAPAVITDKIWGNDDVSFASLNDTTARGIRVGRLLASNAWADAGLVPSNGIYSKGAIHTGNGVYADHFYGYAAQGIYHGILDGRLQNPRLINGVAFDASLNIDIPPVSFYIPAGANLNNYQTTGFYFNPSDAETNQISNVPQLNAFSLRVERSAGCSQWLTPYNSNGITYYRRFYDGNWSNWVKIDPANVNGNAGTATRLQNWRNISLSGAVSGNAWFDGSGDINISTTPNNSVRAFINFNMNTGAIRKSSGIASVTSLGSGVYRINLSQAAPDANYAVVGMASWRGSAGAAVNMWDDANNLPNQNSFCINCSWGGDNTAGTYNPTYVNLAILY